MWGLEGRTVLVTGASGGIGGATVRQLVASGADVIASGRDVEALNGLATKTGCRALPFDLASEDDVQRALENLDLWGVVNCGEFGGEIATPMATDISVFDEVISVNARGALLVIKYASQSMIRLGKGGSIVNVSSQAALIGLAGHISYGYFEGRAGQHHPGFRARTGQVQYPREQREPDCGNDGDVGVLLGPARNRRPILKADASRPLGDGG